MEWIDIYFGASMIFTFTVCSYILFNIFARVVARLVLKELKKENHG